MFIFFFQHQHPYVSAMINNGSLHYDHDTDGTHTQIAGCEAQFRNKNYDTHMAIRYEDNTLKVGCCKACVFVPVRLAWFVDLLQSLLWISA